MTVEIKTSKVWFVTGASSGIGQAVARAALDRGEDVVAVSRSADGAAELAGCRGRALTIAADIRDETAVRDAVDRAVEHFGRIDVVVNAAGYGLFGAVEEVSDAQARALFDTNVFGSLNVLRAAMPVLRAQRRGHVVQGSSVYGQFAHAGVGLLAATKHAVEGLSDAFAAEVNPLGIRVTILEPGFTATSFLANLHTAQPLPAYEGTVGEIRSALGTLPASAFGRPEDVATAVLTAVDADEPVLRLTPGGHGTAEMRSALRDRLLAVGA